MYGDVGVEGGDYGVYGCSGVFFVGDGDGCFYVCVFDLFGLVVFLGINVEMLGELG